MIRKLIVAMLCTMFCWADQSVISLIPQNLWQTYKSKTLPKSAFDAQQTWLNLNPNYSYLIFDDADIEDYIQKKWPPDFLNLYHALPIGAMKADLWRYLILTTEGGIYSDIDSICIQPIQNWLPDLRTSNPNVLLIGLDIDNSLFCQWTIASTPHHPAMQHVCHYLLKTWKKRKGFPKNSDGTINVLAATGPAIFTAAIKNYLNEPQNLSACKIAKKYAKNKQYRARLNKLGIFISPKRFFQGGGSKNLFGSACFDDGYNSWSLEAKRLAKSEKE